MSEHTEEWRLVAASTTAPDPDRFLVPSTPSRDAQLLTAEFCAACPGGPALPTGSAGRNFV